MPRGSVVLLGAALLFVLVLSFVSSHLVYEFCGYSGIGARPEAFRHISYEWDVLRLLYSPVTHLILKLYLCLWLCLVTVAIAGPAARDGGRRTVEVRLLKTGLLFVMAAMALSYLILGAVVGADIPKGSFQLPAAVPVSARLVDGVVLSVLLVAVVSALRRAVKRRGCQCSSVPLLRSRTTCSTTEDTRDD